MEDLSRHIVLFQAAEYIRLLREEYSKDMIVLLKKNDDANKTGNINATASKQSTSVDKKAFQNNVSVQLLILCVMMRCFYVVANKIPADDAQTLSASETKWIEVEYTFTAPPSEVYSVFVEPQVSYALRHANLNEALFRKFKRGRVRRVKSNRKKAERLFYSTV